LKEGRADVLKGLDEIVSKKEETLTKTYSVKEILFDGYPVNSFSTLVKETVGDPELDDANPFRLPDSFSEEKFGFFRNVIYFPIHLSPN